MHNTEILQRSAHRYWLSDLPGSWPGRGVRSLITIVMATQIGMITEAISAETAETVQWIGNAPDFGLNVTIFDPSMPTSEIKAVFDEIWLLQRDNEMGSERYSLYFLPGKYGSEEEPLQVTVGYYTEVAGLGVSPNDVQINGKVEVFNRCFDAYRVPADSSDPDVRCFALTNFWRSISNLTIDVNGSGQGGCKGLSNFWAVSQAFSMRRVQVNGGNLSLMDYCGPGPQYASGGFIADSRAGILINGSQQQWYTRNSEIVEWRNSVWNQVFTGVNSAPDGLTYPYPPYTTLDNTPLSREKPFLFVDDSGGFNVRVPSADYETRGITWANGLTAGRTIPISEFFVAGPSDPVHDINSALARGSHLILTPGVHDIADSIRIDRANTVVLGMGMATLTALDGVIPLRIADNPGVIVAGVIVDAGTVESPVLLQVGARNLNEDSRKSDPLNPTTLSDVYFRVGGPHIGKTDIALEINSDGVLIDHTWVWRADHGAQGVEVNCDPLDPDNCVDGFLDDDLRWITNIGRNGVVINGDDVTATGLFVEHFQEYNTLWNGERGQVYMYQNELPYDPPTQADWMADDGTLGWAAYKVADDVEIHELWGAGVYVHNRNNPGIVTENGYEVPDAPGIQLHHIMINNLSGSGIMNHIVNGCGPSVDGLADAEFGELPGDYERPRYMLAYPPCP